MHASVIKNSIFSIIFASTLLGMAEIMNGFQLVIMGTSVIRESTSNTSLDLSKCTILRARVDFAKFSISRL